MKRAIIILLALLLVLSLAGCGKSREQQIQDALQGSWIGNWTYRGTKFSKYYIFKGNRVTFGGNYYGAETSTIKINDSDSTIQIIKDDGSEALVWVLEYSYNKKTGEITLWMVNGVQLNKGTVNIDFE